MTDRVPRCANPGSQEAASRAELENKNIMVMKAAKELEEAKVGIKTKYSEVLEAQVWEPQPRLHEEFCVSTHTRTRARTQFGFEDARKHLIPLITGAAKARASGSMNPDAAVDSGACCSLPGRRPILATNHSQQPAGWGSPQVALLETPPTQKSSCANS